jgi:dTMP kinase
LIPDQTLPRPDIVFQLDADDKLIVNRENYGDEIYEKQEFQKKLREEYKFFQGYKYWRIIDALRPKEEVNKDIITEIEKLILIYENTKITEFDKNNYPNSVREDLFSEAGLV